LIALITDSRPTNIGSFLKGTVEHGWGFRRTCAENSSY
jgi:hypothetical protein